MGKHSKWFIVLAAIAVVMAMGITAYAVSLNPPTETVDQYLLDAGYPADIVAGLADEVKLRFYNGGYTYESSVTSYGIVTDNYNIAFDIDDNGEIVIDAENLSELEQLQNDNFTVIKILYDKQKAIAVKNENAVDYSSVENPSAQSSVISAAAWASVRRMAIGQFAADNTQMIESVKNAAPAMALRAMANWSNTLTVNHISYSPSNNRVWKNFYYSWFWNYSPVLTLTDKVALAWSGDFISESDSVAWSYTAYASSLSGPKDETWTGSGAEGMHDLNAPGAAVGTSIDIVGSLSGYAYTVYAHSGNYTVDVHQFFHTETDVAAIGQYFHQSAVIGGVGLSVTGVPSITAGSALNPHPSDYKSFIVP